MIILRNREGQWVSVRYPRRPREPIVLSGASFLLRGSYLTGISHFPDSGGLELEAPFSGLLS